MKSAFSHRSKTRSKTRAIARERGDSPLNPLDEQIHATRKTAHDWYKDAIFYQLHVKAFFDSTGDGIGDFAGLTQKLDYLVDLGVTAVWLLPFYPSPLRDDGYDIADYRNVHPSYGAMRDFREFVRAAHRRGLRVITELVVNHTSDEHAWFQRARRAPPGSKWRNYYVWSDTDQKYQNTRIIFCDTEKSNWAWDPEAQAYYWHRFFSHQPDLNYDNPRVFDEITRIMKFWFDAGVDGMRLDAVPYLCERDGTNNENLPETHAVLKRLRAWLDQYYPDRMFLAEANQWPEDVRIYFGDNDECHMAFHFPLMPRMYMALAREDRYPITDIMRQTPDIPDGCQWAIFLRNHDELTLEMVTVEERDYLWGFYAPEPRARINLGIRRRLAPLLDADRRKIELLNSLLMSMPGTPIIYYGDEIGMGDNIFLGDRNGVRTPMQWSPDRNAGFSKTDPERLYLPPVMDSVYGFEAVNVESQLRQSSSLLNWMRRLIAARKAHPAFGRGSLVFLYPGNRKILAYLRSYEGDTVLCVANVSNAPQAAELELSAFKGRVPVEMLGRSAFPPVGDLPYFITLPGYGFYWFLLAEEAEAPNWHEPYVSALPEFRTLVLPNGWDDILRGENTRALGERILPEFLPNQRWFAAKEHRIVGVRLADALEMNEDGGSYLVCTINVTVASGDSQQYFLPLALNWDQGLTEPFGHLQSFTLSRARVGADVASVHDAMAAPGFPRALVAAIRDEASAPTIRGGRLVCRKSPALDAHETDDDNPAIERLGREQSNTSVFVGETMILKVFRRLEPGVHPELEIGRFLTEVAAFANVPPTLGSVEMIDEHDVPTAIAILQGFVRNQGDGWTFTLDYLERVLAQLEFLPAGVDYDPQEMHVVYTSMANRLGTRLGELHAALAIETDDPAFQAEPITDVDIEAWRNSISVEAEKVHATVERLARDEAISAKSGTLIEDLLRRWHELLKIIDRPIKLKRQILKTRTHGDLHLGQVVVAGDDFYFLDFEGEPMRDMDARRLKQSPMRDVAGMLRSLNYAALSGVKQRAAPRPEVEATLQEAVEVWERLAANALLEGYREATQDCPSVPSETATFQALLDLFLLEKALYEVRYEAANRPEWVTVPLRGLMRLLARRRTPPAP